MKRIVTIESTTGVVLGEWAGGDEQDLAPVLGRTQIRLAQGDTTDYSGQRWTGTAFEDIPREVQKHLSQLQFYGRFQSAERDTLRTNLSTNSGLADWWTQFELAPYIDLDDPRVGRGIDYLIAQGYLASARKTEILTWP